jgi:hypothetical protein
VSIAVICQTGPLVPCSRPTKKQSMPTNSPGYLGLAVGFGRRRARRFKRRAMAHERCQALSACVQPVPDQGSY